MNAYRRSGSTAGIRQRKVVKCTPHWLHSWGPQNQMNRRLSGSPSQYGCVEKTRILANARNQTTSALASSSKLSHCTDCPAQSTVAVLTVQPTIQSLYWLSSPQYSCCTDCPAHNTVAVLTVQPTTQLLYWLSSPQYSLCTDCLRHTNIAIMTVQPTTQSLYWLYATPTSL